MSNVVRRCRRDPILFFVKASLNYIKVRINMLRKMYFSSYFLVTLLTVMCKYIMVRINMLKKMSLSSCFLVTLYTIMCNCNCTDPVQLRLYRVCTLVVICGPQYRGIRVDI